MKELSIEEKAKAYDEAKLRMSAAYNSNRCSIGFMNEIFPGLAESEDERIRKELIDFVKSRIAGFPQCERFLAWLEKQGEQKPNNQFTPKQADVLDKYIDKYLEKKPAWSEEDGKILSDIDDCIKNLPIFYKSININGEDKTTKQFVYCARNWLKSIKDRVQH